jgi:hypothetical protein
MERNQSDGDPPGSDIAVIPRRSRTRPARNTCAPSSQNALRALAMRGRAWWIPVKIRPDITPPVPTLFRFLLVLLVLGGIGLGAMFALATLISPEPREMSETIPATRLMPQR